MADDTISYLEAVVRRPAHLVGWSDGAVVGLVVAQRRPDLIDRLVLIGQYYNSDGRTPGGLTTEMFDIDSDAVRFLRARRVLPSGPRQTGAGHLLTPVSRHLRQPSCERASLDA